MAWREIIYQYDGSFEGLLCCVFESYTKKERPTAILHDGDEEPSLFEIRAVVTDHAHAQRIYRSLYRRSPDVGPFLRRAFLTCLPDKEMSIYRFIVKFYQEGAPLLSRLSDETYLPLLKAVRHLSSEVEQFRGFTRFSDFDGVLGAEIEPKNRVLPLLRGHFCQRYANEQFFIYDRTHRELLLYANGRSRITQIENFQPVLPGEDELYFRSLWKQFFQSVAIRERENPRCQNTFMPKRYRGTMTEFLPLEYEKEQGASPKLPGASGTDG
jgi:probable DNA metabolism protein